ncbi:MAG: aspartate--tRNA(Asn) ligase, partial [Thermoplasmata archaeon]|nr:aspartate--tRNA(Asn) ligase [Thermoplasmata archaeon]
QMKEIDYNPDDFEFYLQAFRYGMPSHGGFGLGIERVLHMMLRLPNIRECVLFPRDMYRVVP